MAFYFLTDGSNDLFFFVFFSIIVAIKLSENTAKKLFVNYLLVTY